MKNSTLSHRALSVLGIIGIFTLVALAGYPKWLYKDDADQLYNFCGVGQSCQVSAYCKVERGLAPKSANNFITQATDTLKIKIDNLGMLRLEGSGAYDRGSESFGERYTCERDANTKKEVCRGARMNLSNPDQTKSFEQALPATLVQQACFKMALKAGDFDKKLKAIKRTFKRGTAAKQRLVTSAKQGRLNYSVRVDFERAPLDASSPFQAAALSASTSSSSSSSSYTSSSSFSSSAFSSSRSSSSSSSSSTSSASSTSSSSPTSSSSSSSAGYSCRIEGNWVNVYKNDGTKVNSHIYTECSHDITMFQYSCPRSLPNGTFERKSIHCETCIQKDKELASCAAGCVMEGETAVERYPNNNNNYFEPDCSKDGKYLLKYQCVDGLAKASEIKCPNGCVVNNSSDGTLAPVCR